MVPSAPVMGDTDYSDPFDARLDPHPETAQGSITPENNGYMEPYEAQKVITGQLDFVLFLLVCVLIAQGSLGCPLSRMERMKYKCVILSDSPDIQCCQTVTHCRVSHITVLYSCNLFRCFIPYKCPSHLLI